MPDATKENIRQGLIEEGHLREIMQLCVNATLTSWLTTEEARQEMVDKVKENTRQEKIDEGHLHEFFDLSVDGYYLSKKGSCVYCSSRSDG